MQGKTEEIISQRLNEDTDCKIYWNTELVTYTQDKNGVKSTIRDLNTKQEQVIESTYIVGADGSHSRVRKDNPEWTFEGVAIQTKFVLADLTLRGDDVERLMDRMNVFFKGTSK
jgi:2-polyprenyl-6-methoxyphenol hydroxylase-like FAD-dependent oxidoreductase